MNYLVIIIIVIITLSANVFIASVLIVATVTKKEMVQIEHKFVKNSNRLEVAQLAIEKHV